MGKLFTQALFVIPIVAIAAAPVILNHKNPSFLSNPISESAVEETMATASISSNNSYPYNNFLMMSGGNKVHYDYSMPEPFADHNMFDVTYAIGKVMNPATWMLMMTNMMNHTMTSMMNPMLSQQMTMAPMIGIPPQMMMQHYSHGFPSRVMTPEQYREWYEKQQSMFNKKN